MEWIVLLGDEFEPEFVALPRQVQDETLAMAFASAFRSAFGTSACRYA
jgi:hypothetical protein